MDNLEKNQPIFGMTETGMEEVIAKMQGNRELLDELEEQLIPVAVRWVQTGEDGMELRNLTERYARATGADGSVLPANVSLSSSREYLALAILCVCADVLTPNEKKKLYIRLMEILEQVIAS